MNVFLDANIVLPLLNAINSDWQMGAEYWEHTLTL